MVQKPFNTSTVSAGFTLETWNVGWMRRICGGESQADGRGADDIGYSKGPHVLGCKLTCSSPDRDVLGGEPHALANPVGGSRSPPPVGLLLHPSCRSHQVAACGTPRLLAPPDECRREETPTSSSWLGNKGGWYPRQHLKGDSPEAADVWPLMAYSAQGN